MTLKTIFSQICEQLEDVKDISNKFANLKTDEERFELAYDSCIKHISKLNLKNVTKSSEKSIEVRKIGNGHFAKKLYWDALKFYNESLALAPNDSEELALAYGNRAACLLKLEFPKEASEDVEKALKLPATNDFKQKLLERKLKCLRINTISSEVFGSGDAVSLTEEKSLFFDSASISIGLLRSEQFERQLVAENDIRTGEVLIIEKPYSSVLLPDHYYTHCTTCFKRSINLIPCEKCSRAMFCSDKCKALQYHNIECSILDILVQLKAERMELLSLRLLIDASLKGVTLKKLNSKPESNYESLDFYNIYNLVTNSIKRSASDLFHRSFISVILIFLLEKFTDFFDKCQFSKTFSGGLILRFMQSLPCNAHEISEFCEDGLNEIGAGAYATLSLINHSCDPNVVRYSYQDVVALRAIRPIKKDEQILDNYGYHYATHIFNERQNALMKQYYFKCECEPCVQSWPQYEDLPEENLIPLKSIDMEIYGKLTEEFEENLKSIFNGKIDNEIMEKCMRYLDFLDEYVKRPWKTYNKCQEAIKFCLSFQGNYFRLSKKVLPN